MRFLDFAGTGGVDRWTELRRSGNRRAQVRRPPPQARRPAPAPRRPHTPIGLIAGTLLAASAGFVGATPSAGTAAPLVRPAPLNPGRAPAGSVSLGPLAASQQLSLRIVLAPTHAAALRALLADLYSPTSPQFHLWLRKGKFDAEFGPSKTTVGVAEAWLKREGLKGEIAGSTISIAATAGQLSAALGISFEQYRAAGVTGYIARRTPLVPRSLAGRITAIVGLNTVENFNSPGLADPADSANDLSAAKPAQADGLTACAAARADADSQYLTLNQVGAAYGFGTLFADRQDGSGQTIGVYEVGAHSASDVATYAKCFGLSNPVTTVAVDGGGNFTSEDGYPTIEADLDIETVMTEAPGARIISYEGPVDSETSAYDIWNAIVTDDAAQVISSSVGECEPQSARNGDLASYNQLFEQAAAQGQTITIASDDFGSESCLVPSRTHPVTEDVDFPASDAWVTAVGGTTLRDNGTQVAWNDCQSDETPACGKTGQAGGGGMSRDVARPNYQPDVATWPSAEPCGKECRELPDISANSGTKMVYFSDGSWGYGAGTSFAAPLMAGLVADRNVGCASSTGLFNPTLYSLYDQGTYGTAFTDITAGNNDLTGLDGGNYPALPGYDLATGIGTPLAAGLSCPDVTSVSGGAGGLEATVNGLGLEKASIKFGNKVAQVVSATATRAIVVVPLGEGTVKVSAISVVGAGNESSKFTYPAATASSPG